MDSHNLQISPNISNIICSIKFFLILDNSGNRIYCSYYISKDNENQELGSIEAQKIFEKKIM